MVDHALGYWGQRKTSVAMIQIDILFAIYLFFVVNINVCFVLFCDLLIYVCSLVVSVVVICFLLV